MTGLDEKKRREAIFNAFKGHRFFDGVESGVAKNMSDSIVDEIVRQGATAAHTDESDFTDEHWTAVLKKLDAKLMALRFCFDMLPAPYAPKEKVADIDEWAEFTALANAKAMADVGAMAANGFAFDEVGTT